MDGGWVEGVSTDTRKGCSGALFVALEGSEHDGHEFLEEAADRGAAAVMVASSKLQIAVQALPEGMPVFDVPDPLVGLQRLASSYRDLVNPEVVAVTGSNGKTGTKDMIRDVLSSSFKVHATAGNLNNHIGLPLTILGMDEDVKVLVAEMGANHKKEILQLARIARPRIGVITNIGPGHLEFFGSLKGVAAAKSELLEAIGPNGTAVLPADDRFLEFLKQKTKGRVVTFGYSEGADWRVENDEMLDNSGYRFEIGGTRIELKRRGRFNILNAAASFAVGSLLGVPADTMSGVLASSRAAEGRGVLFDVGGILIMDDSYNSNPASLAAALEAFMEMGIDGRRWLVLGDMLELGGEAIRLHREAGENCGKAGVDGIVTLGDLTVELNRAAAEQRKAPPDISHFMDAANLASYLNGFLEPGDAVLVKGSRGMRMEKFIEELEKLRDMRKRRID